MAESKLDERQKEPTFHESLKSFDEWLGAVELRLMKSYVHDNGDGTFSIRKPPRYTMLAGGSR